MSFALPFYKNQDSCQRLWCSAAGFELQNSMNQCTDFFSSNSIYTNSTFLLKWSKIVKILLYPSFSPHELLKQILTLLIQTQAKSKSFLTCWRITEDIMTSKKIQVENIWVAPILFPSSKVWDMLKIMHRA